MTSSQSIPGAVEPKTLKTPYGEALQISTKYFLDVLIPPLDPILECKLSTLERSERSRIKQHFVTKDGRLWGFNDKPPSMHPPEVASRRIQGIVTRLMNFALPPNKKIRRFYSNENTVPRPQDWLEYPEEEDSMDTGDEQGEHGDDENVTAVRDDKVLPDAYVTSSRDHVDWSTIVVSGVYSHVPSDMTNTEQDIEEVTRCMATCMRADACRRFTYGFMTEDETMTLWFCDRRHIILSESFNFTTEYIKFFRFLLACLSAPDTALGIDPTIIPIRRDDGSLQYEVTVRSANGQEQRYRTIEELAGPDLRDLIGRGTRVWKAVKVVDGEMLGEPVALKDAWVDDLRDREGDIDASIRASTSGDDDREAVKAAILTVLVHGDVFVGGVQDQTRLIPPNLKPREAWSAWRQLCAPPRSEQQTHYRIVYEEIGESLYLESSVAAIFKALGDACKALRVLHTHGWIHGDISIGNVLLHEGRAKLADLEYAQPMNERRVHDRTGTHMFMPVEVAKQGYLFQPPFWRDENGWPVIIRNLDIDDPPFCYNPLHDLESLWWLAVYFFVTRTMEQKSCGKVQNPESVPSSMMRNRQRALALLWFWHHEERLSAMSTPRVFEARLQAILCGRQKDAGCILEDTRSRLSAAYTLLEKDLYHLDFGAVDSIYHEIATNFDSISSQLAGFSIAPLPMSESNCSLDVRQLNM